MTNHDFAKQMSMFSTKYQLKPQSQYTWKDYKKNYKVAEESKELPVQ